MVLVAMAEDQRIDRPHGIDIGQKPGRRPFAEVEHQPPAAGLKQEAGRALGADAGDQPQCGRSMAHRTVHPHFGLKGWPAGRH